VLDATVPEVIRMTTSGRVLARYAIARDAVVDPSGGKFEGLGLDGIALDPTGRWLWLVTDPPHDSGDRYGPAGGNASTHYEKGYSMLYRAPLAR
jgi:hypothetical protein